MIGVDVGHFVGNQSRITVEFNADIGDARGTLYVGVSGIWFAVVQRFELMFQFDPCQSPGRQDHRKDIVSSQRPLADRGLTGRRNALSISMSFRLAASCAMAGLECMSTPIAQIRSVILTSFMNMLPSCV